MASVKAFSALVNNLKCQVRVKLKHEDLPESWANNGIGFPVYGYIELKGPWPFRQVEWVEVNPITTEHIGRLVAPKEWNYLEKIVSLFHREGINYGIVDHMIRVPFDQFTIS